MATCQSLFWLLIANAATADDAVVCDYHAVVGRCLGVGCWLHGPENCINRTKCMCKPGYCAVNGHCIKPPPTPAPTPAPTPEPTPEPTPMPTPEPTPMPTPEPTQQPTLQQTSRRKAKDNSSAPSPTDHETENESGLQYCLAWVGTEDQRCNHKVHAGACYDSNRSHPVQCLTQMLLSSHECPADSPDKCIFTEKQGKSHETFLFEMPKMYRFRWNLDTVHPADQFFMILDPDVQDRWMKVYDQQGDLMGSMCPAENPGSGGKYSLCFNFESSTILASVFGIKDGAPGFGIHFRWYMFLGCIIFAIPAYLHYHKRESWRDTWAATALAMVCLSSVCCDAIFTGSNSVAAQMIGWQIQMEHNGTKYPITEDTFSMYSAVLANDQLDAYSRIIDRVICVVAVVPAFGYFLLVERGLWSNVIVPIWFLLSVGVVQTGMAIRQLNTCYYDGRPFGSAPMILHTIWHISLVGLFSWNCLHRPHKLEHKDPYDLIGNRYGLDNSLTRQARQERVVTDNVRSNSEALTVPDHYETPLLVSC